MGNTIREIRKKIWRETNPFAGLSSRLHEVDAQGWGSQHPYLSDAIEMVRPKVIVEVGVWKGGSTIHMAKKLRELGLDAVVISVDTWLGSWDHWINETWFRELNFSYGYPQLFYKFATNIIANDLQDYIIPLPLDSVNAREVISRMGISVDILHIDAGHDYAAVTSDLTQWWSILRSGGCFVGDDYYADGVTWPNVKHAIDTFLANHDHANFQHSSGKCNAFKP